MKNRVLQTTFLLVVFSLVSCNMFAQKHLVADLDDISSIYITPEAISNYIKNFEASDSVNIEQMLVAQNDGRYYLLAQVKDKTWVYILELKQKNDALFLKRPKVLNACSTEDLSLDAFNIKEGKIQGCTTGNHMISAWSFF